MQSISSLIAIGTPSRTEIGSPGGQSDNENSLRMLRIKLLKKEKIIEPQDQETLDETYMYIIIKHSNFST